MQTYLNKQIKEVLTQFPAVGKIIEDFEVGCVTCGVASCMLKDVVQIHNISEDRQAELMYNIEKAIYPDRKIAKPVASTIKKPPVKLKYSPPVKRLVDEHIHIMKVINSIPAAAQTIDVAKPAGKQFVCDAVEFIRLYADKFHHMKEEDILFDYCDRNSDIIKVILDDHTRARGFVRSAVGALEAKNTKEVFENLTAYARLLTEHIKKEDEILYPWIDRGLSTSQVGEMFVKFNEAEEKIDKAVVDKALKFSADVEKRISC